MPAVVTVTGVKEVRKACRQAEEMLGNSDARQELRNIHHKIAEDVIGWAKTSMPKRSGKFAGSYKASKQVGSAVVRNTLVYAGVNEYGGRIPNRGAKASGGRGKHAYGSRGTHLHKPKAPRESYFVYPAIRSHEGQIARTYEDELNRLIGKYFR